MYASFYVHDIPHFDIHPPLGKLIYASVLYFYPSDSTRTQLIYFERNKDANLITPTGWQVNTYGSFPYLPLRMISAIFGVLIPIGVYLLARSLGIGENGSLLASFISVFENSLLLHTRLILLDGMYIVFGLFSLALFFSRSGQKKRNIIAGLLWGLSLGVKFTAITFIGPVIVAACLKPEFRPRLTPFIITGLITLLLISSINSVLFPPQDMLKAMAFFMKDSSPDRIENSIIFRSYPAIGAWALWFPISFAGYVGTGKIAITKNIGVLSSWTDWIAGRGTVFYDYVGNYEIGLVGNPIIWIGVSLSVIFALILVFFSLSSKYKIRGWRVEGNELKTVVIILAGYLLALSPFVLVVRRETLGYHYFPALVFGFILLGWSISHIHLWLNRKGATRLQVYLISGSIIIVIVAGFLANAKYTYGFPLTSF